MSKMCRSALASFRFLFEGAWVVGLVPQWGGRGLRCRTPSVVQQLHHVLRHPDVSPKLDPASREALRELPDVLADRRAPGAFLGPDPSFQVPLEKGLVRRPLQLALAASPSGPPKQQLARTRADAPHLHDREAEVSPISGGSHPLAA